MANKPTERIRATASSRDVRRVLISKFCNSCNPWMHPATNRCKFKSSHLQYVALARHQFVQHWIHKKSQNQSRDQSRHDHDRERFLRVGTNSRGKCGRQQAQTRHQRGHHDRPQPQQRCFARRGPNVLMFQPQFVDVRNQNHGGLYRDPHQRQQSQHGRHAERRMRQLQCNQRAHRLGHHHAQTRSLPGI